MADFHWPKPGEHHAILGCTGSGKTTVAYYFISRADFHKRPYFVIDYKGDDLTNSISRIREIGTHERIPDAPGLYVIRPLPTDTDDVEEWLRKLWEHENAGLYVDEGYLLPDKNWIHNLYAQGRSKNISITMTSQRPVNVPRSAFTEASYISVMRLNDRKDMQRVQEFTPQSMLEKRLPDFHSLWYSVKHHKADDPQPYLTLGPVPGADEIIDRIDSRLMPKARML